MKSEIFNTEEIGTKEAWIFLQIAKEQGQSAKEFLSDLHLIDELLIAEKTKPIFNRRYIDIKNNKVMIDNIIEKHLKCAARKR
jgi:hypothetical protein